MGATADGAIGPKTLEAILKKLGGTAPVAVSKPAVGKYDVFLDAGHTSDNKREYPSEFKLIDWSKGDAKFIADTLGFKATTRDSVEHRLNVSICLAAKAAMEKAGLKVFYYDDPSLGNDAEISRVYKQCNELNPRCFVSVHNNAQGGSGWQKMGCAATGTVSLYYPGRSKGKSLAKATADALVSARKSSGGPHNRADNIATTDVAVVRKCDSSIPATLIEVGFYDNFGDLLWMAKHLELIGQAICKGVLSYLGK